MPVETLCTSSYRNLFVYNFRTFCYRMIHAIVILLAKWWTATDEKLITGVYTINENSALSVLYKYVFFFFTNGNSSWQVLVCMRHVYRLSDISCFFDIVSRHISSSFFALHFFFCYQQNLFPFRTCVFFIYFRSKYYINTLAV